MSSDFRNSYYVYVKTGMHNIRSTGQTLPAEARNFVISPCLVDKKTPGSLKNVSFRAPESYKKKIFGPP